MLDVVESGTVLIDVRTNTSTGSRYVAMVSDNKEISSLEGISVL